VLLGMVRPWQLKYHFRYIFVYPNIYFFCNILPQEGTNYVSRIR
jgi:hypothetical protein